MMGSITSNNKQNIDSYFSDFNITPNETQQPPIRKLPKEYKKPTQDTIQRTTKQTPVNSANHSISKLFFGGFGEKEEVDPETYIREDPHDGKEREAFIEHEGEVFYDPSVLRNG